MRAKSRSNGFACVPDPQDLWPPHLDPALPGPQGPQHHRTFAQALACGRPQDAVPGVGTERRHKTEKLIRNLARCLEHDAPGVSDSILEGLDEILTVTSLGLPVELHRSLACTNINENMNGTIRQVCRKRQTLARCQDGAFRWTGARHAGGRQGLPRAQGTQATARPAHPTFVYSSVGPGEI